MTIFLVCLLCFLYDISSPTAPTTPTLEDLSKVLESVEDWESLGRKLGLQSDQLHEIEQKCSQDSDCKNEILSLLLQNDKLPTWKSVVDALGEMNEYAVATKIQTKYCSSSTDVNGMFISLFVKYIETKNIENRKKDVGIACQKVYKQSRDEIKVKVIVHSLIPQHFFCTRLVLLCGTRVQGWGFVYFSSLLCHPFLVCMHTFWHANLT